MVDNTQWKQQADKEHAALAECNELHTDDAVYQCFYEPIPGQAIREGQKIVIAFYPCCEFPIRVAV